VNELNQRYPNLPNGQRPRTARGQTIPLLSLPSEYEFGDAFHSQDIRISRFFEFKERYRISVFAEMFNVLNVANLGGFSGNLANPAGFGQPTSRASQVFGSGGPRALQLGARFSF
jgi:hypothetical protein